MDPATREAHHRYARAADRVETAFVIGLGLLIALAIGIAFLYALAAHVARGVGPDVGD